MPFSDLSKVNVVSVITAEFLLEHFELIRTRLKKKSVRLYYIRNHEKSCLHLIIILIQTPSLCKKNNKLLANRNILITQEIKRLLFSAIDVFLLDLILTAIQPALVGLITFAISTDHSTNIPKYN